MTQVQETIETFFKTFEDVAIRALFVQPDGSVFSEDQHLARTPRDAITEEVLYAIADEIRQQIPDEHLPLLSFEWNALRWTLMQPPLTQGVALVLERLQTPRAIIPTLIEEGWLDEALAEQLHALIARRDNVLIAAPLLADGQRVLAALLDLLPEGERNVFIGDVERVGLPAHLVSGFDRFLLREFGLAQRRMLSLFARDARRVWIDQLGDPEDLFWWTGGNFFGRGRVGVIEASDADDARRYLKTLALTNPRVSTPAFDLVQWVVTVDTSASGARALSLHPVGEVDAPEPLTLPEISEPEIEAPIIPQVAEAEPKPEAEPEPEPEPEAPMAAAPEAAAAPAEEGEGVDSRLSEAVSSAFADFGSMFSLDDDDSAPEVSDDLEPFESLADMDEEPESDEPEVSMEADDSGGEDDDDAFSFGLTFEPGELDVDDDEPPAPKSNSRHPQPQPGGRSSTSRYNADKVRQDAEAIRNQRSRYRPPPASAQRPGQAPPPRRGEANPSSPRWENGTSRSGRGATAFRERWRQPPSGSGSGTRGSNEPRRGTPGAPRLQRPSSSPSLQRPSSSPSLRPPRNRPRSEELPMLASADIEAVKDEPTSEALTTDGQAIEVPKTPADSSGVSALSSLSQGLAKMTHDLDRKKSGADAAEKGATPNPEPDSEVGEGVELFPEEN